METCTPFLIAPAATFQVRASRPLCSSFEKGAPTRKIWYYQSIPGRNLGKTNPLNDDDLAEFVECCSRALPIRLSRGR